MYFTTVIVYYFTICFISDLSLGHPFKTCNLEHDFKECISAAIEDGLKKLKNPLPEFDLPSFDPLNITNLNIPSSHKDISIEEHLNYLDTYGIPDAKVENFDIDFAAKTIDLELCFPNLTIETSINFSGEVFGEHIHFAGHVKAEDLNSTFKIQSKFEEHVKDEKKYIKIVDGELIFDVGNDTITFEDKNKDEEEQSEEAVKEHHKEVIAGIIHGYEHVFFGVYAKYFNQILDKIPVTELFDS